MSAHGSDPLWANRILFRAQLEPNYVVHVMARHQIAAPARWIRAKILLRRASAQRTVSSYR